MKGGFITFCFVLSTLFLHAQSKKPLILPGFSIGYLHQGNNNIFGSLGLLHFYKRHTYLQAIGGVVSYKDNNKRQFRPNFTIEYFYETKQKLGMGPSLAANYSIYKFDSRKTNCISLDVGWSIYFVTIFGGYNFNIDNKLSEQIAPFRVGIKYP